MAKRGRKHKPLDLEETQGEGGHRPGYTPAKILGGKSQWHSYSITDIIRKHLNPKLVLDWWMTVLGGGTPLTVKDNRVEGGIRIIPDPNPMVPSPTLADRMRAIQELTNRGWGLPVQSLQIDAHLKATLDQGVPQHLLDRPNYAAIAKIRDALMLTDVTDAEIVSEETSEVIERSVPNTETIAINVPTPEISAPEAEAKLTINENSPPEDDSSEL